jgi:hypothetical protein
MQSELQELKLIIPCSKIGFGLLVEQQKEINRLRSRIPSSHSKNYQTLSSVLHLYDFLVDTYLDAITNLVLIQDYAEHHQYFAASGMYCRSHVDSEVYEQVIRTRKIASENSVIGCPSKRFSKADWEKFHKYGLNQPFELK